MAGASSKTPKRVASPPKSHTAVPKKPKPTPTPSSSSYSDEDLKKLLEPYSKDQLISLLSDAALSFPSLLSRIRSIADRDVSHRKLFIHGLSWDTTRDDLLQSFSPSGHIEECTVVLDKLTARAKGYAFVLFATRSAAQDALRQPHRKIRNRVAHCQLASAGPAPHGPSMDTASRKLYVSNVHADVSREKLRDFFATFGEIELGPLGFDVLTGKSRGFALFVYKTPEGLKKVLEEPFKMFEGHQLHCQRATDSGKGKVGVGGIPAAAAASLVPAATPGAGVLGSSSQQLLAAVAVAQNLALYSQNPAYAALLGQNPLVAAAVNQATSSPSVAAAAAALNPSALAALNSAGASGLGAHGATASMLDAYALQGTTGSHFKQSPLGWASGSYRGPSSLF